MKDIKDFIIESKKDDFDEAIEKIKHYLIVKQNYKEDDFRIIKTFGGNEIRVYFPNETRDEVRKIGEYLYKALKRVRSHVTWKTMGRNNKGEYYQAFK